MSKTSQKKSRQNKSLQLLKNTLLILSTSVIGFSLGIIGLYFYLSDRIYPAIEIADINISSLTKNQAKLKLETELDKRSKNSLEFKLQPSTASSQVQKFVINLSKEGVDFNLNQSIIEAYQYGHQKFYPLENLTHKKAVSLPLDIIFNTPIEIQIKNISQNLDIPPIDASLKVEGDQIIVSQSQDGKILDQQSFKQILSDYLNTGRQTKMNLPIKTIPPKLSYEQALEIKNRLDQIKLSPLKLTFKDQVFTLSLDKILSMIDLQNSQSSLASLDLSGSKVNIAQAKILDQDITDSKLTLNEIKVKEYLKQLSLEINRDVQEPLLNIDPASDPKKPKIIEFKPPQEGQTLLIDSATQKLSEALLNPDQTTVKLPVQTTPPKNKLVNDLGIKELIGRGVSNFAGSIPNRIFNIGLAASRINGILIAPGETFSFVNTVGDITASTGYKQAYVIKSGRTILDDGGGVCQVSTTLFRTVLYSGLPVVQRTAHAYRVGYYEQGYPPGLDATIFYPSVDFQFKNDTPATILIQAYTSGYNLYVDFYGTSDGRVTSVSKPVITNQVPPPPQLHQDDPTLPKGTVKQVDFPAWGANVVFNRTVLRNGQTIINENFKSNYRPWQAIYLVGTKEG